MAARTQVGKKHFMKSVHDELVKFEHKEIEFQKTERNQRAARLRLPIGKHYPPLSKSAADGSVQSGLIDNASLGAGALLLDRGCSLVLF